MTGAQDDGLTSADDPPLASDVVTGEGCRIAEDAVLATGVSLAHNVVVDAGAHIGAETSVGAGAFIGEHAIVHESVVIGPNAVVAAGTTVGTHAQLTAGSVATRDVPAFAIAEGNPARIIGYRSSPAYEADRRLRASSLDPGSMPMALGRATLHEFPRVDDLRGGLVFGEIDAHLPFAPLRYFTVFDVPSREVRGEHCHKTLHELLICVHGECTVMVNDGTERAEVVLDRPDVALHLRPMTWTAQYQYSSDAVLMVLCSHVYEADDYIRTYAEFERLLAAETQRHG